MFVNNEIKKQLEKLSSEEENKKCFDCEAEPARWTSLNNGIYLCHECSEEHKNIESGMNIIKSITLEQWNKNQLNIMKIGGNKRLKKFLEDNNVPKNINKKALYNSKIMVYYRKLLKSEAEGELLLEQIPSKEELWESYLENNNNSSNNNNLNFNMNFNTNTNEDDNNLNINNQNNNIVYYDNDTNNQFTNGHLMDYPQSSIRINEDQYIIAKEKKILEEKLQNSVLKKDSLLHEDEDPKFSSVSSESENNNNSNSFFQNSGYIGTIGNIVNTMKEKINEYQIGKGILYIGGKVFDGVIFIGGKIIETGSDIIHSETAQNIVSKAGEGLKYIANKITGNSNNNNENSSINNYIDISDDVNNNNKKDNKITNFNTSSDYENNYGILNDQNENLLV